MASRAQRTPFGEWWWTVDRLTLAALGALDARRHRAVARRQPAGRRPPRARPVPFRRPPHPLSHSRPPPCCSATSFLSPREIRRLALVVFVVSLVLVAATPYFGAEIKGARRWLVILGVNIQPSEFLKPAFVILIAWLFGEIGEAAGHAGQHLRAGAAAHRRRHAVGAAARFRPDHADRAGVGRAVLHGRHAADLGVRPRRHRRRRPDGGLLHRAARRAAASAASSIRRPATPSTSTSRPNRSCAAAGSAAARARARSSASCPKATPISCSRWRRRNSASCSASFWSRCSLSS